jgi:hypothetical protein
LEESSGRWELLDDGDGDLSFHPGTMYDLPKKMEVAEIYIGMCWAMFPKKPSCEQVGEKARVSSS